MGTMRALAAILGLLAGIGAIRSSEAPETDLTGSYSIRVKGRNPIEQCRVEKRSGTFYLFERTATGWSAAQRMRELSASETAPALGADIAGVITQCWQGGTGWFCLVKSGSSMTMKDNTRKVLDSEYLFVKQDPGRARSHLLAVLYKASAEKSPQRADPQDTAQPDRPAPKDNAATQPIVPANDPVEAARPTTVPTPTTPPASGGQPGSEFLGEWDNSEDATDVVLVRRGPRQGDFEVTITLAIFGLAKTAQRHKLKARLERDGSLSVLEAPEAFGALPLTYDRRTDSIFGRGTKFIRQPDPISPRSVPPPTSQPDTRGWDLAGVRLGMELKSALSVPGVKLAQFDAQNPHDPAGGNRWLDMDGWNFCMIGCSAPASGEKIYSLFAIKNFEGEPDWGPLLAKLRGKYGPEPSVKKTCDSCRYPDGSSSAKTEWTLTWRDYGSGSPYPAWSLTFKREYWRHADGGPPRPKWEMHVRATDSVLESKAWEVRRGIQEDQKKQEEQKRKQKNRVDF